MYIRKVKVRTKNPQGYTPCAAQLVAMLGCWASSGDKRSMGVCADAAAALHACMRTHPPRVKAHKPAINFHLSRLRNLINK
ncbi:hypothetical protein EXIGLDRAFT_720369 [Exidia glandulosa HHB12029]|uniref:37S ribosomal protein mrp10, mitochondrial n=1 Tax=Exidia glandulosa HHB12029 TaxID=1314781 RepID=A0A165GFG8_EXIGL|nr:hypothetical protein EXIGLDRAFT_720369 [Exidia glandulosa HHB12029]